MFKVTFAGEDQGTLENVQAALGMACHMAMLSDGYDGPATVTGPEGFKVEFHLRGMGGLTVDVEGDVPDFWTAKIGD